MPKMIVEFEWPEDMGAGWMNIDNLKQLLYSEAWTNPEYLLVIDLTDQGTFIPRVEYGVGKPEDCPCGENILETPSCGLCGKPMPKGEEMFQYHGYSGPCPE